MPLTLITTIGGDTANSYCSLAEADLYHEAHPHAASWVAATDDQKNRALATATRLLDEHWEWSGWVVTETQRLGWPRSGMYYENGWYIPPEVIPPKLKEATAEFARQLLAADRTADNDVAASGIASITAGSVGISFTGAASAGKPVPDAVWFMIQLWGQLRRKSGAARLVRS